MEYKEFHAAEFDAWAARYDDYVVDETTFPFIGYKELMVEMVHLAEPAAGKSILDLGCGTGNLGGIFAERGAQVWSTDFSQKMLKIAKQKFPALPFAQHDLRTPLPGDFPQCYDMITSTYVFHHFLIEEKIELVQRYLNDHLNSGGKLIIGDLVFQDREKKEDTKNQYPDDWDDEYYWVLSDDLPKIKSAGLQVEVSPISVCAAVLVFSE